MIQCLLRLVRDRQILLALSGINRIPGSLGEEPHGQTGVREILAILPSGPYRPWPSRPHTNKRPYPLARAWPFSNGKHVGSSRTDYSHYSRNPSDLGSEDQEKRPPGTFDIQNGTDSSSCSDDLEVGIDTARWEQQTVPDAPRLLPVERCAPVLPVDPDSQLVAPGDLDELLADLDMSGANVETAEEVIAEMSPDDLDADEEHVRVAEEPPQQRRRKAREQAEEARRHRLREARERMEAIIAEREVEWQLRKVSRKVATIAEEVSRKVSPIDPDAQAPMSDELEALLADLDMEPIVGTERHHEMIETMLADLVGETLAAEPADTPSNEVAAGTDRVETLPSNEVLASHPYLSNEVTAPTAKPASNKVTGGKRRSDSKDRKALEKIRSYSPTVSPSGSAASVAPSTPSITPPPSDTLPKAPTRKKRSIGSWDHTDDRMKLVAATTALQVWENATSWTFNLTPDGEAKALAHPRGFIGSLSRAFNRALNRKLGFRPHYLFSADITKKGRLHLHGAIQADDSQRPLIEEAMKEAWGEWKGRGKEYQVDWNPQRCDDGWPDYFLQARARVREKIGDHTYVITKELRRRAKFVHGEMRDFVSQS
jgi:hypothetical protein